VSVPTDWDAFLRPATDAAPPTLAELDAFFDEADQEALPLIFDGEVVRPATPAEVVDMEIAEQSTWEAS